MTAAVMASAFSRCRTDSTFLMPATTSGITVSVMTERYIHPS